MTRIGFVGLGNMGGPMAASLVRAGHVVVAFDLSEDHLARAVEAGAARAGTAPEAATGAEAVVTMLPSGAACRTVWGALFPTLAPGTLCIDCSTIDVATARALADDAAAHGLSMLDAPVSGGTAAAAAASLTFMVGGEPEAFERGRPLLAAMGKAVIHAGGAGNGQAAKICNNMLLGISMIGTCEAFVLARRLGLDAQVFFDIASRASGQCWSMTAYCPVPGPVPASPANRDYAPGFATAMMLKDLRLAAEAAHGCEASVPLGGHARDLYEAFAANGGAELDFSAIIHYLDASLQERRG